MKEKAKCIPWVISAFTTFLLVLSFLFGSSGILNKPKLDIFCKSIELGIPINHYFELSMIKMMLSPPEDFSETFVNEFWNTASKLGLSDEVISKSIVAIMASENTSSDFLSSLGLEAWEERAVMVSAIFAQFKDKTPSFYEAFNIPTGFLYFEIVNNGSSSAEDVHISLGLSGIVQTIKILTDNEVTNIDDQGRSYFINLESIEPNSRTQITIWLGIDMGELLEIETNSIVANSNTISITYRGGTVRKSIDSESFEHFDY